MGGRWAGAGREGGRRVETGGWAAVGGWGDDQLAVALTTQMSGNTYTTSIQSVGIHPLHNMWVYIGWVGGVDTHGSLPASMGGWQGGLVGGEATWWGG